MPTTMLRDRLKESRVEPRDLAAALFYTRNDIKHYEKCIDRQDDAFDY